MEYLRNAALKVNVYIGRPTMCYVTLIIIIFNDIMLSFRVKNKSTFKHDKLHCCIGQW